MTVAPEKKASLLTVARAVLWSFLGIRRRQDMQSDLVRITPLQVAVMGVLGAAIFVGVLVTFVHFVTSR
ncbi:MAG: DUF2970 domain-containing protein [Betaproteobacteria bacterium]|jgi:hypothetical protein